MKTYNRKIIIQQPKIQTPLNKVLSYSTRASPVHSEYIHLQQPIQLFKRSPYLQICPGTPSQSLKKKTNMFFAKASDQDQQKIRESQGQQFISTSRGTPKNQYSLDRRPIMSYHESNKKQVQGNTNQVDLSKEQPKNVVVHHQKSYSTNNQPKIFSIQRDMKISWAPMNVSRQSATSFEQQQSRSFSQQRQRQLSLALKQQSNVKDQAINQYFDVQIEKPPLRSSTTKEQRSETKNTKLFFINQPSNSQNNPIQDLDESFEYVLRYAIRTRKGYVPNNPHKVNQDNYIICPNIQKKSYQHFFAICDGHGGNGHFVSGYLKQHFPILLIQKKLSLEQNPLQSINEVFSQISQKLIKESQIDVSYSGSTVVSLYLLHNKVYCANLGDSRAIIGKFNKEKWLAHPLSRDHKPSEPLEQARILASGGRVETFKDVQGNSFGPLRVWIKDDQVPGLAMTRSMGDLVAASVGVSHEPEITEYTLKADDRIIVLASDGVWEFLDNQEIIEFLAPYYLANDLEGACEALMYGAHTKWLQNCLIVDDISFILIFMNY